MKENEKVLVFPKFALDSYLGMFNNNCVKDKLAINSMLNVFLQPNIALYMNRAEAEKDPEFKQVIPYTVLADKTGKVFAYRRSKKGGETRLHGNLSLGVGGHINPPDGDSGRDTYEIAFFRELAEEVSMVYASEIDVFDSIIGVIYDPSNEVGQVHFGVVHKIVVDDPNDLIFRDEALIPVGFQPTYYWKDLTDEFENWSKIVLANIL